MWPTLHGVTNANNGPSGCESGNAVNRDWQTPNAMAGGSISRGNDRKDELLLAGQAKQWATPKAEERQRQNSGDDYAALSKQATQWPSPSANDDKGLGEANEGHTPQLRHLPGLLAQGNNSTNGKPRGSLNSAWVTQLMGYPSDWLDLPTETLSALSATRSSPKSSRLSRGTS